MIDTTLPNPLLIIQSPREYFVPMTVAQRDGYVQRLRLDDPTQTPIEMHNQYVREQEERRLRQITNSRALSSQIAYKRGQAVGRDF